MFDILLIVLIVLLLTGGGYGYRSGAVTYNNPFGIVLGVLLILLLIALLSPWPYPHRYW